MKHVTRIVIVALLVLRVQPALLAAAGSDVNAPANSASRKTQFDTALEAFRQQERAPSPEWREPGPEPTVGLRYTSTDEMQAEIGQALYADYMASLEHNRRVFEWQLRSSRMIFWVVLVLVTIGILFSALQFWKAFRLSRPTSKTAQHEMHTELEISTRGIKVSSSVLGVIVLVISLAFLYLFLVHVYPIEYVRKLPISAPVVEKTE